MSILQAFLTFLAIVAFGCGMFFMGFIPFKTLINIRKNGIETTATVSSIERSVIDRHTNDVLNNRSYAYKLSFMTQEGKHVTIDWDQYQPESYKKCHPQGSTIRIKYLPERYEKIIDMNDKTFGIGLMFMILLGICLWIFAIFFLINVC